MSAVAQINSEPQQDEIAGFCVDVTPSMRQHHNQRLQISQAALSAREVGSLLRGCSPRHRSAAVACQRRWRLPPLS